MDWLPRSEADTWLGITEPPMYYDRAGNPIPMVRWTELWEDFGYRRIAETEVAGVWRVSTIWLGLDHGFSFMGAPPDIFETMVFELAESHGYAKLATMEWCYRFHAAYDGYTMRYSTETEARGGHAAIVAEVRELFLPVKLGA